MTLDDARKIALSLPESSEQDHWGNPSFRVRGKIFATVPDTEHINVMINPLDVEGAINEDQAACEGLWWGKELRGVRVSLRKVHPPMLTALLEAAWRRKAPRRLVAAYDASKTGSDAHQKAPSPTRM
jgi:hypothetical protein